MSFPWPLAQRAERMNPSVIREILKAVSYTHLRAHET